MRDILAVVSTGRLLSSQRMLANKSEQRRNRSDRTTSEEPRMSRGRLVRSGGLALPCSLVVLGCSPTVDIGGVYFPGWLMSTMLGITTAYGIVSALGRNEGSRDLADSGLFFVGLVAFVALSIWWLFFRGF